MVGQVVECPFPKVPRAFLKGATVSESKGAADGREASIVHGSSCKDEWRSDGGNESSGDMVTGGYYTPGTFQEYVLGPIDYVTPIPESVPSELAAPMLCAGVTVYAALKRSKAQSGDFVVISGAGGGLGHLATQIGSRGLGFRIIGVDHGSKADLVKENGAEAFVDITQFPKDDNGAAIAEHVKSLTNGHGAHAVIVCTASNIAYAQAIPMLRFNGSLICVGVPEGDLVPIATASPGPLVLKQISIEGSAVGNRRDALEVLDFVARGIIKPHVRTEKLEKLTSIFEEMHCDSG
ncbi:hypothetical protein APSETT445_009179 [Aspergillus pseudonomiae]